MGVCVIERAETQRSSAGTGTVHVQILAQQREDASARSSDGKEASNRTTEHLWFSLMCFLLGCGLRKRLIMGGARRAKTMSKCLACCVLVS